MLVAPDDGTGVVVLINTGGLDGRGAPELVAAALLRRVLGLSDRAVRPDIPARAESWSELCGWYGPEPGPVTNLLVRATMGAGAEVTVRGGHLLLKPLIPVPAMRRGLRLHPGDRDDPEVFRVDLSESGRPPVPVVFSTGPDAVTRLHMLGMALRKRPNVLNPRPWTGGALLAGAAALAVRRRRAQTASGTAIAK